MTAPRDRERVAETGLTARVLGLAGTAALLVSNFFLSRASRFTTSASFHTVTEPLATSWALSVGVIAFVRYYTRRTNIFLLVATAFLGTGLLDTYHAVVTSPSFSSRFPSEFSSLPAHSTGGSVPVIDDEP